MSDRKYCRRRDSLDVILLKIDGINTDIGCLCCLQYLTRKEPYALWVTQGNRKW
jgi:hypothetical protein